MSLKGRIKTHGRIVAGTVVLAGAAGIATSAFATVTAQPKSGEPLKGLTAAELSRFEIGKTLYGIPATVEDGLGPIFNKAGCFSCHTSPLGGWGSITVTRFGYADKGSFDPLDDFGGSLLQVAAIDVACQETIPEFANVVAQRLTNASLAYGLVESIPGADILANADPDDLNADGISGRAHMVEAFEDPKGSPLRVGRFGWKSGIATVLTFSADAAQNEMGITNRFLPFENAPNGDLELLALCDTVADPEDSADGEGYELIDRLTDFQRFLGPPPQTPKSGMTGEALFTQVGCNQCHTPQFTTSNDNALEDAIRGRTIRVYSDFLLHNMGILGDGIPQGDAGDLEFRTPTLWNLRTRDPMLHDGRAAGGSFFDRVAGSGGAIWWHDVVGSEAQASGSAFFALSPEDQELVVGFLDSLGRREFDFDGNDVVNEFDFDDFKSCFGSVRVTADMSCAIGDVDQDGDVDLDDATVFFTVYTGPNGDCDGDGTSDLLAILLGAADKDGNRVPDACEQCPADLDLSGSVDGADLGELLSAWGQCRGCAADLDLDGFVDGSDLGALLAAWGDCP